MAPSNRADLWVHLIRNSLKYCGYQDRRAVVASLKPIYTAPTIDAAADALDAFETDWGDRYPASWRCGVVEMTNDVRQPDQAMSASVTTDTRAVLAGERTRTANERTMVTHRETLGS